MLIIQIDQSRKIGEFSKDTRISAVSASSSHLIIISAKLKRAILMECKRRKIGKKRVVFLLFSYSLAKLIMSLPVSKCLIQIDREYPGHEFTITEKIYDFLKFFNSNLKNEINFVNLPDNCKAHTIAYGSLKPDKTINLTYSSAKQVLKDLKLD